MKKYIYFVKLIDTQTEDIDNDKYFMFLRPIDMITFINHIIDMDLYRPLTYYNYINYINNKTDLPYITEFKKEDLFDYVIEDFIKYYPNKIDMNEPTKWKYILKIADKLVYENNETIFKEIIE